MFADIGGSFLAVLALAVLYECVKGIHVKSREKKLSEKTFNNVVKK